MDQLEQETKDIRSNAIQLTWAMRGGVQYTDVLNMSLSERKMISDLSKENIEVSNKSGLPFF